ncbi:hypothetical protein J4230_05010 [Candidatus Woesearchaeota archaeon]|nr:hypothetical protein [Candidatus Woesearchaeota archaeon]
MPKEDAIIRGAKIKYKGTFDFNLLYRKLREWLIREKYSDPCESGEKKYSERIKPSGKQIEVVWSTSKGEEGGYFSLNIDIKFFVIDLTEIEVEKDGKKIKMDKCEVEIEFSSKLIRNANKAWDEDNLMFKLYERYIVGDKTEQFKIELYKDTNKLMDEVKNFFNLYRF